MAFETLLNVVDRPDVAAQWPRITDPDPSGGPAVWRTYPRYAEMFAAAKTEADGSAAWARWAPGVPHNEANLQVDVALATAATWGAGGGGVDIELVQLEHQAKTNNGNTVITLGFQPGAGSCVVIMGSEFRGQAGGVVTAVTDNEGNTYTVVTATATDSGGLRSTSFIAFATDIDNSGGALELTVVHSASGFGQHYVIAEFTGVDNVALDKSGINSAFDAGPANVVLSDVAVYDNDLVLAVAAMFSLADTDISIVEPAGYTAMFKNNNAVTSPGASMIYKIGTPPDNFDANWTHDDVYLWSACIVALRPVQPF